MILYGTGIRLREALTDVTVTLGDVAGGVEYAGAQGEYVGLDQLNVKLPRTLIGRKEVTLKLSIAGKSANALLVNIK